MQDCSLPPSTADVNEMYNGKRLPKGIHVFGSDDNSAPKVETVPNGNEADASWSFFFVQHFVVEEFANKIEKVKRNGIHAPKWFAYREVKHPQNSKSAVKEDGQSLGAIVFMQGDAAELKTFLMMVFPQHQFVKDSISGEIATISDGVMKPFMQIADGEPERVTFLRDPFVKFANDHVKLRLLTGVLAGQEGYVVRILRDRHFVMNFGGYAVAISRVHNEDFQIAE